MNSGGLGRSFGETSPKDSGNLRSLLRVSCYVVFLQVKSWEWSNIQLFCLQVLQLNWITEISILHCVVETSSEK